MHRKDAFRRQQVVQLLELACNYYARYEPSSPVPLLLQRAKRLVDLDFLGIVADLSPETLDKVVFAATPGKKPSGVANAGMLTFTLPASGAYRVALDMPVWIDVAANGALMQPKDFEGQHSCAAPHKIVEFDLKGTRPFFLQLSGTPDSVRLTLTAAPARKL